MIVRVIQPSRKNMIQVISESHFDGARTSGLVGIYCNKS